MNTEVFNRLCAYPDYALAYLMLREDRLYNKIPDVNHYGIIKKCLDIGETKARGMTPFTDITTVARNSGVRIALKDRYNIPAIRFMGKNIPLADKDDDVLAKRIYCSEYLPHPSTIIVYQNTVDLINNISKNSGYEIRKEYISDMFISHEFYHHLEAIDKNIYKNYPRVSLINIAGWHIRVTINICSEIAAMAFAKTLLNVPFFPKCIDFLIQYQRDPKLVDGWISLIDAFIDRAI